MSSDHTYSILDVCSALHGDVAGSGHVLSESERVELCEWLQTRLNNWEHIKRRSIHWQNYETAVALLAQAALNMSKEG